MDIVFGYADKLKVLKCMLFYAGKLKMLLFDEGESLIDKRFNNVSKTYPLSYCAKTLNTCSLA